MAPGPRMIIGPARIPTWIKVQVAPAQADEVPAIGSIDMILRATAGDGNEAGQGGCANNVEMGRTRGRQVRCTGDGSNHGCF